METKTNTLNSNTTGAPTISTHYSLTRAQMTFQHGKLQGLNMQNISYYKLPDNQISQLQYLGVNITNINPQRFPNKIYPTNTYNSGVINQGQPAPQMVNNNRNIDIQNRVITNQGQSMSQTISNQQNQQINVEELMKCAEIMRQIIQQYRAQQQPVQMHYEFKGNLCHISLFTIDENRKEQECFSQTIPYSPMLQQVILTPISFTMLSVMTAPIPTYQPSTNGFGNYALSEPTSLEAIIIQNASIPYINAMDNNFQQQIQQNQLTPKNTPSLEKPKQLVLKAPQTSIKPNGFTSILALTLITAISFISFTALAFILFH